MNGVMTSITEFFNSSFGIALKAVLVLLIAFLVSALAKSLIVKLLSKTKLGKKDSALNRQDGAGQSAIELIGKLVQLIVFLLFVPGIFQILGMNDVSAPIIAMLTTVASYIPNIIGAVIIIWIGFYVARLVRDLLIPVFEKLQVNKLQAKLGIKVDEAGKLSNTLAYIAYVLILIPVIIAGLYVLNISVITDPAVAMLKIIFSYIPSILAALIIISIGLVLARFIGNIVTRLIEASGLDAKLAKVIDLKNKNFTLSYLIGKTIEVILVIFFIVESVSTLRLGILTRIGTAIIAYMPYLLTAFMILVACIFLAALADKALAKTGKQATAILVKYLIYVVGAFMILNELGIARTLVDSTFILAIAAIAVAFAISFGIGGREFAKNTLAVLQNKLGIPHAEKPAAPDPKDTLK